MINKILEGMYNFIFSMVGTFTQPISDFINNTFPDLSNALSNVTAFFNSLGSLIAWVVYLIPKPFTLLMLTTFLSVFIITFPGLIEMDILGKMLDFVKRIWPFGGK